MGRVQETITKIMIDRIEARRSEPGFVAPWRQTWDASIGMPRNLISGHGYRGVNVFMTLLSGYRSPYWVTRRQLQKIGGSVNVAANGKREPYTPIVFWKFPTKEERDAGRFPFCKFYQVWNTEQLSGIENHPKLVELREGIEGKTFDPIAECEGIVQGYSGAPEIRHGGSRACYVPSADRVEMPERVAFEDETAYYRVLFHELIHSTGHRTRLERDGVANPARFASHEYSEEELVAEMGASILASFAGISNERDEANSAAYLDHWLKKLKQNPGWLVAAGGQAQKAADLIRGIKWEKAEE